MDSNRVNKTIAWVMVVPITDVVKITLSVADISVEPIIGTPLYLASYS